MENKEKIQREIVIKIPASGILNLVLVAALAFSFVSMVYAVTPNPGHDFTSISGGVLQGDILFGSGMDTLLALPKNITATRYLSNTGTSNNPAWAQVDLTNGVTGVLSDGYIFSAGTWNAKMTNPMTTLGDIIYGGASGVATRLGGSAGFLKSTGAAAPAWSAVSLTADVSGILPTANGGTGVAFFTVAGPTTARVYTFPDAAATVLTSNAPVTVAQGGTGLATLTTGNVVLGAGSSNVTFVAPGTSGNVLTSNGSTWTSAVLPSDSTMTTVITQNASGLGTGANAAVAQASLTAFKVGMFNIPYSITVNQLAYNVGAVTTAGTYRICVYNEAGTTKHIDVTDVPAAGVNTVAVGAVALTPGNYHVAIGCATTCNNTVFMFTSTANTMVNTSAVPTGKKRYEGLVTMTSGTCNTTIDPTAMTGTISHTPVVRLDN